MYLWVMSHSILTEINKIRYQAEKKKYLPHQKAIFLKDQVY